MKNAFSPIIGCLFVTSALHAGVPAMPDAVLTPVESKWSFRIAPYAWVPAIDGDIAISPLSSTVDVSLADTLDFLDIAFMMTGEASYGKWSLNTDFIYGEFSHDVPRADLIGAQTLLQIDVDFTQLVVSQTLGYRVIESENHRMDVLAGARFTSYDTTLTGRFDVGSDLVRGAETTWIDPIIGLRGQHEMGGVFFCRYYADIGGFGVSSDFVWQAFAGAGYRINPNINVALGYRGMGIDHSSGRLALDITNHGPIVGFEICF